MYLHFRGRTFQPISIIYLVIELPVGLGVVQNGNLITQDGKSYNLL